MNESVFIQEVAQEIVHCMHKKEEILLVAPTQRIYKYLKKELDFLLPPGAWMFPKIISPNTLFQQLAKSQKLDAFEALVWLFNIQKEVVDTPITEFENYYTLGKTTLTDFNEVDQYLVDAKALFYNVKAVQDIEQWSLHLDTLSEGQEQYVQHMADLYQIYQRFVARQVSENKFTSGQLNRQLNETEWDVPHTLSGKTIFVIGLNAVSKAEMGIYQQLKQKTQVKFIWELDPFFLQPDTGDSGLFIRQNIKELGGAVYPRKSSFETSKTLRLLRTPNVFALYTFVGNQLSKHQEKTTAVLMDETALPLVLNGIEAGVPVNISMGMPLNKTAMYSVFQQCLMSVVRFASRQYLTIKELVNLCNQPGIGKIWKLPSQEDFVRIFPSGYFTLDGATPDVPLLIFLQEHAKKKSGRYFLEAFLEVIRGVLPQTNHPLEREGMLAFLRFGKKVVTTLQAFDLEIPVKGLKQLVHHFVKDFEIDLIGEPLTDNQICGLLETRGIPTEQVLFCGLNENLLPGNRVSDSFIPPDLRFVFGLPGKKEREAVFAYYFFRLVCSSSSIELLFLSDAQINQGVEVSRFIRHLKYFAASAPKWNIDEQVLFFEPGNLKKGTVVIADHPLNQRFLDYVSQGVSPSAINTFFTSPLNFCVEKLLNIHAPIEHDGGLDPRDFGVLVHGCLEDLFSVFEHKILQYNALVEAAKNLPRILDQRIVSTFHTTREQLLGKKKLMLDISLEILESVVQSELSLIKALAEKNQYITILALEKHCERLYTNTEHQVSFNVHGVVDRLEQVGSVLRVIDYKTGKAYLPQRDLAQAAVQFSADKNTLRQLLLYGWMFVPYCKENNLELEVGVLSLQNLQEGTAWLRLSLDEYEAYGAAILSAFHTHNRYEEGAEITHPESLTEAFQLL